MKFKIDDIGGEITKQDDRYIVKDNTTLKNLVVSSTKLKRNKSTTGHSHAGQEEVYYFIEGNGMMELGEEKFQVWPGDVVLIPDGVFHKVQALGDSGCYFVCVFDGTRGAK